MTSIGGRAQHGRERGIEDREPLLDDVERVYGVRMADVVRRYIDNPGTWPGEERYEDVAREPLARPPKAVADGFIADPMFRHLGRR